MEIRIRLAIPEDVPVLGAVIEASVRGLQAQDYTARQIELALKSVYGVDTQLIADGTYFAVEAAVGSAELGTRAGDDEKGGNTAPGESSGNKSSVIVGCGGWSRRKTLFGGDQWRGREDDLLDPARDAAKIRAFFVRPERARRGIGTLILDACETAAKAAGFRRLEMGATLSGVPFYAAKGYAALENVEVPLGSGLSLPIVRMAKAI
jgi:GNAT superfamily N-acetyltransferase